MARLVALLYSSVKFQNEIDNNQHNHVDAQQSVALHKSNKGLCVL
jgi:hypothetical protein